MSQRYKDFIRIKRGNRKLVLQVMQFEWLSSHEFDIKWQTAKTLETSIELNELDKAIEQVLNDARYFAHCSQCHEYSVRSLMYSETHCQGCAQRYLGVVY